MKMKVKIKKKPKINWDTLNVDRIFLAVAGDCAATIQQRIRGSKVTPALKQKTIKYKKNFKTVPLMETKRLAKNIKSRYGSKKKTAEVYIRDSNYPTAKGHTVTTNEIAVIHTEGMGKNLPKRKFFYVEENNLNKIWKLRVKQGIAGAMKRAGVIK